MHHMGATWEPLVPYGSCVFAIREWCALYRSCMGAMCPCGSHMVPNRRWMVPYGSCKQHLGATGTMWEPYGSCVGNMGGGWCHAPSVGHVGTVRTIWEAYGSHLAPCWSQMEAACTVWGPYCIGVTVWELCALYGSCAPRMSTMHAIWEPHGA
jgi:hypothetical protein